MPSLRNAKAMEPRLVKGESWQLASGRSSCSRRHVSMRAIDTRSFCLCVLVVFILVPFVVSIPIWLKLIFLHSLYRTASVREQRITNQFVW